MTFADSNNRFLTLVLTVAAALVLQLSSAEAQWPTRYITLVVPVGAGTVTDSAGRLLASHLKDILGQSVVVENRPGAGTTLGAREVARAASDGYTLLLGGNSTHSAAKSLLKIVPYDPIADFTPIARVGKLPTLLATNPQQPFKTIHGLVEYARANPGKLTYGHGNSVGQIIGETLKSKLNLNIVRLPYSSNPPAIIDLMNNNIQLMIPDFLSGLPLVESGKIVPLAVGELKRSAMLPDTPTVDETVVKGFEVLPWSGIYGPAKLPPEIVDRLVSALQKVSSDPAFIDRLKGMGVEPYFLAGEAFAGFTKADVGTWATHAKVAGIEPQ